MYVSGRKLEFDALGGLRGFGALVERAGVRALQRYLNNFATRAGYAPLSVDGKYGAKTHAALKQFAKWYAALPGSTLLYVGDLVFDNLGPMSVNQFLSPGVPPYTGLTAAQVADAMKGFSEWVNAGRPSGGAARSKPAEPETTASGDSNVISEDILPPQEKRAGLGTLGWVMIGIGIVAAGSVVYYLATRKSSEAAAAGLLGW